MSFDPTTIASVDIGTSKVTVIVAEYNGAGFAIRGWHDCPAKGVQKGVVKDYAACSQCTQHALEEAKKEAQIDRIDSAFLALSGGHLQGFPSEASLAVSSEDNRVTANEVEQLRALARAKDLPEGRMLLESLRRPYQLDGRVFQNAPEHHSGRRLDLAYWMVHGDEHSISDALHMLSNSQTQIDEMILSGICSGRVVTSQTDREHGVLVIDIGAGTTDYALYRYGRPYIAGVLAVGGEHLTSDLSQGFRLSMGKADRIKLRNGRASVQCRDKTQKVWLEGKGAIGDAQLPLHSIEKILELRVRELLEVVRKSLGADYSPNICPAGVILTGGTSKLPGIADVASEAFGVPAHLAKLSVTLPEHLQAKLSAPGYHTALGLLIEGIERQRDRDQHASASRRTSTGGFFRRLFSSRN